MTAHAVVLDILTQAASQNPCVMKPAEEKLRSWETEPGFYVVLKDICCDYSIDVNVRMLTVLYLKNGVEKYWRPHAPNAIPEGDKCLIRQSLQFFLNEPIKLVVKQLALVIAKISRIDCPKQWPELIPELIASIKSPDINIEHRSLLILHHVVQTLMSKMLSVDRKIFQDLSNFVFADVFDCWQKNCDVFFLIVSNNKMAALNTLERCILCLKLLKNMTVRGFDTPHENQFVDSFLKGLFERTKMMLQIRVTLDSILSNHVGKVVVRSMDVFMELALAIDHIHSFKNYFPMVLEFTFSFVFTPEGELYIFEKFLMQCMSLIISILRIKSKDEKEIYFTPDIVVQICKKIMTHYFLLTRDDIDQWVTDPESFAEINCFRESSNTEMLFKRLVGKYPTVLVPLVMDLLKQNEGLVPPSDFEAIVRKDAIYRAVGIVALELYDEINFASWLINTLHKELAVTESNYRILKWRIAWLIGQWLQISAPTSLHGPVYSTLLSLLDPKEDIVIRITAADSVKLVITSFEFSIDIFIGFLQPMFHALYSLLKDVQECSSKLAVMRVMLTLIEKVKDGIEPYYLTLVQYLPLLWRQSEEHHMLRCTLVNALSILVKAVGKINKSNEVSEFVLSIISLSTGKYREEHDYLLEDGLELWLAVVECEPHSYPELLNLFKNILVILENNANVMSICISIIKAYLVISPQAILHVRKLCQYTSQAEKGEHGRNLVLVLKDIITDMKPVGLKVVFRLVHLMLQLNGAYSCTLLRPLLPKLLLNLYQGNDADVLVMCCHLIMSRVLLESKEIFNEVINEVSILTSENNEKVLNHLLDPWLNNELECLMVKPERKLLALGLSTMLTMDPSFVYNKFGAILLSISDTLEDVVQIDENGAHKDSVMNGEVESPPGYLSFIETEHEKRMSQLMVNDVVFTTNLEDYFKEQLFKLKMSLSPGQFEQFLQTVDSEILAQVRHFTNVI